MIEKYQITPTKHNSIKIKRMSIVQSLLSHYSNNFLSLRYVCLMIIFVPNVTFAQVDTTIILDLDSITLGIKNTTLDTIVPSDTLQQDLSLDSLKQSEKNIEFPQKNKIYTIQRNSYLKDSMSLYYKYDNDDSLLKKDSSINSNSTHEDDLTKRDDNEYLHLGNIGSSATPMLFSIDDTYSKDIGLHQYDFFNTTVDSFKYFQVQQPYSHAYFNTGSNKNNFSTGISFINSYKHDLNLYIDFRRINQEGLYTSQKTKHSDFKTSLYWDNNRHELFFLYYNRTNTEHINGGVFPDQDFGENPFRANMAINLSGANIRHYSTGFKLTNKYLIGKLKNVELKLYHQISYQHNTYNFHDQDVRGKSDSLYYLQLIKDERGIRHDIKQKIWNNNLGTSFSLGNYIDLNGSVRYQHNKIENDFYIDKSNIIDLLARIKFSIQRFNIIGNLNFNIAGLEHSSNFNIAANLKLNKKFGRFQFVYRNLRKPASYIQNRLILNADLIWNNDFELQTYNSFKFEYINDYLNAKLNYTSIILDDHILLNEHQILEQSNSTFYIQQINFSQAFNYWKLHSDHHVMLQLFSNNLVGLPTLFTKHNLYFKHQFKSSDKSMKIGANIRYTMADNILKYQASIGSFYKSDQEFSNYWTSELYLAARISTFRFYVKYTNIDQLFDNKIDYQIFNNPQFDSSILFGIDWILYN